MLLLDNLFIANGDAGFQRNPPTAVALQNFG